MRIEDYPAFCRSIWTLPRDKGLTVAGLGIVGEACEVGEALLDPAFTAGEKVCDECGDVLYYATVLLDNWSDSAIVAMYRAVVARTFVSHRLEAGLKLCAAAKEVSERVKKHVRDGASLDELDTYVYDVLVELQGVLNGYGLTLEDALEGNVRKLSKRYCTDCGHKRPCLCLAA